MSESTKNNIVQKDESDIKSFGFKTLEIGSIGYNHTHDKNFIENRPYGIGCHLFLLIKSPAHFELAGKRYDVRENSYVLIQPHTPCIYRPVQDTYTDDWLYFNFDEVDNKRFEELGIEFDKPTYLGNVEELSQLMHFITFEHFSSDYYHKEIENHYGEILFYKLGRIIKSKITANPDLFASKNDKLLYLKSKLYEDPQFFNNVEDMSNFMNLSRSSFQHLYKKVFGTNVMNDVIHGRIEFAKKLLSESNFTIAEIAIKSGYKSEYSFMRQFKEITERTPTEYRKSDNWTQNHYEKQN